LALVCLLALSAFIGLAFLPGGQAKTINAGVVFDPHRVDLGSQTPPEIIAIIRLKGAYDVYQIDPSTILMEGYLPPLWTEIKTMISEEGEAELRLLAHFDGDAVEALLWAKIYHLGIATPNPHAPAKIELDLTGNLLPEYDGTLFEGTGRMHVIIPLNNGPPPP
jgi:hypothetical protein